MAASFKDESKLDPRSQAALLERRRGIARERMIEQFAGVLAERGAVFVDCGFNIGHAYVTRGSLGEHTVTWLAQEQVRTLAGRID